MEDCEQVLKNKMAFGVDTPPRPGDEGDETLLSKYSLHSKMSLVPPRGMCGGNMRRNNGLKDCFDLQPRIGLTYLLL